MSLKGKRVVITRAREQSKELAALLEGENATSIFLPVISFVDPPDVSAIMRAARELHRYDVVVFTSTNAVHFFLSKAKVELLQSQLKVAAIGEKTKKALQAEGVEVQIVPKIAGASEELLEALVSNGIGENSRVLFPRALEGRDILVNHLTMLGVKVDLLPVYQTMTAMESLESVRKVVQSERADWITFASGSQVRAFFELGGVEEVRAWIQKTPVKTAVLGRITEGELLQLGIEADVVAVDPSMESMVEGMKRRS